MAPRRTLSDEMQEEQDKSVAALAHELELDAAMERFFSEPPAAPTARYEFSHEDWDAEPLSSLERVAMLTTAAPGMAMLAVGLTLLFCSL